MVDVVAGEDLDSHSARRRNRVDFLLNAGLVLNESKESNSGKSSNGNTKRQCLDNE
jgi:hypothetical protein